MNKLLRIHFLVFAALLCCGCSKVVYEPQIPYGLLIKCRDFLTFCIFLVDQEKPYYNHIAQRYYYALLTMASITFQWRKGNGVRFVLFPKHDDVWKLQPIGVRDSYGKRLKGLRTRCDYHHDKLSRDQKSYRDELSDIICSGDRILLQLEEQTKTNYKKFFASAAEDSSIRIEDCDILMDEIHDLNRSLKEKL